VWDVVSGTDHGATMGWIAGTGVAAVAVDGTPTDGAVVMAVIEVFNTQGVQCTVVGNTLVPVLSTYYITAVACGGNGCPPEDELTPLLSGTMTFEYTSATTVTLSGSGIVVHLRARPQPTGAAPG